MKAALAMFISIFVLAPVALLAQNVSSTCAKLTLNGPPGIANPGDSIEFYVEAEDPGDLEKVSFEWRVDGRSFNGQGSSRIQIPTTKKDGNSNITAFVKINGKTNRCSAYLSESGGVAALLPNESLEEFVALKPNDLRGRLDSIFTTLMNDPQYEGVLVLYFPETETKRYKLARLKLIYNHILFRRFNKQRLSFYLDIGPYENTVVWRIPKHFDYTDIGIDESKLIKAEEFKAKIKKLF